jgi:hypothetical protein
VGLLRRILNVADTPGSMEKKASPKKLEKKQK